MYKVAVSVYLYAFVAWEGEAFLRISNVEDPVIILFVAIIFSNSV